ncbi:MAG: polysaccharide biosynthesis C-terminal domain-containing protein [Oscillospiraceae bacterium]|nr:polysaccharide biosynthesis C-terminal domain-containing protein [Oscillospiraceae bacterium]
MNKYRSLALNTVVFTIGSFGSKFISIFLNNLYTKHIDPASLFTKSLLETLALFLIPVFTFSLKEALIRYGLDKDYDKKEVFSTAAILEAGGLGFMLLLIPILPHIPYFGRLGSYTTLLGIYILTSSLRAHCSQFVRACEKVRLFSLDGILTTLMLFLFNLVFIGHFEMGVRGFMLSTILSDFCSAVFLFVTGNLRRYFSLKAWQSDLAGQMLRFTVPLIPTTVMWTFTGFSDQLFIGGMKSDKVFLGENAAGIYAAAAKIPNLISMLSTIFFQAWNMSAITENDSEDRNVFYEKVYSTYEAFLYIGSAGLLLLVKPVSSIFINYSVYPEYATAYLNSPLLIAAAVFTCLDLFLASIYTATKHTRNAFYTILIVFLANILLNLCLIPLLGIQGAALATLLSYMLCFWVRIFDARRYVPFRFYFATHLLNTGLLLLLCGLSIFQPANFILMEIPVCCGILLLNRRPFMALIGKLLKRERK